MDQGSLFANQDANENIYFYCLSCNYKKIVGLEFYDKIVNLVKSIVQ
jgi:hypothetical protein